MSGSLIVGALGVVILFKGRKDLGEYYIDCGNAYIPEGLRTDGIYACIRHPIYSGNLLLAYSAFLVLPNYLSLFVCFLLTASYAISIPREEESLCEEFSVYKQYQKLTGRLLPRVVVSSYTENISTYFFCYGAGFGYLRWISFIFFNTFLSRIILADSIFSLS